MGSHLAFCIDICQVVPNGKASHEGRMSGHIGGHANGLANVGQTGEKQEVLWQEGGEEL